MTAPTPRTLEPVSNLAATAFTSATEALEAVLALAQDLLGMGSVFITEIDRALGQLTVVAVHEGANGCGVSVGMEVPLDQAV